MSFFSEEEIYELLNPYFDNISVKERCDQRFDGKERNVRWHQYSVTARLKSGPDLDLTAPPPQQNLFCPVM